MKIGQAANILGVSIDTVRRWSDSGKLASIKTPGGTRLYEISELEKRTVLSAERTVLPTPDIPHFVPPAPVEKWLGKAVGEVGEVREVGETSFVSPKGTILKKAFSYAGLGLITLVMAATALVLGAGFTGHNQPSKSISSAMSASGISPEVLAAVTPVGPYLEINTDTIINGNITANNLKFATELDQSLTKTSSPTFTALTLSAPTAQLNLPSGNKITLPDATGTVVLTNNTQTLTNKTMSGGSNTFTDIPNSALTNHVITVTAGTNLSGGGDVNLGSSITLNLKDNLSIVSLLTSGNASVSSLFANGTSTIAGNFLPNVTSSYDLGSTDYHWNAIYVNNVYGPPVGSFWFWQRAAGVISPATVSDDLAIGGVATATAKFQVFGTTGNATTSGNLVFSANPLIASTAKRSLTLGDSNTGNIVIANNLVANGSASISGGLILFNTNTIQSTANQTLTLGGNTTGNIVISPNNTTVATFTQSNLDMNNLPIVNIGNAGTDFGINGGLTLANALTVSSGGIGVTSGGITITAGGLGVTSGNITLSSGQSIGSAGTMSLSTNDWGISSTGSLTGISGIANDGAYTQTGGSVNTFSGPTTIANTASISGALTLYGTPTIGTTGMQSLTLGNANTGNIDFVSKVGSNILPATDSFYDLGSASFQWNDIYARNIITPGAGIAGYWQRSGTVLTPVNAGDDVTIGGWATVSGTINGLTAANGIITGGTWHGTLIATQYGGSGKDWSAVAQGNLPYFDGTGTMTTLAPDTANKLLITNGTGANPSWANISSLLSNGTDITFGGTTIVTINDASTLQSVTGRGATTTNTVTFTNATVSGTLKVDGNTILNNLSYAWPGTQTANGVLTTDGVGLLSWVSPGGTGSIGYWQRTGGSLAPFNLSDSINLGSTATTSALVHLAGTPAENSFINTGNLGIGTTSPAEALDINGRIHMSQVSAPGVTTDKLYNLTGNLAWNGSAVCTAAGNCAGTASALGGSGATGYIAKWSGTYTLSTSLLYDTGTEVQISGNATASGTLGVGGNTQIDANLNVKGDVTLNRITAGTWQGTVLGTKYGGTGKDWSAVAQGGVPYFDATGSMNTLGVGTASQVLTTSGANADPAWTNMASLVSQGTNISITGTQTLTVATVNNPTFSTSVTTPQINSTGGLLTIGNAASVSGALTLYGTPTIGTTSMQSLTLGDSNTGNIQFYNSSNYISSLGNLSLLGTVNSQTISNAASFTGTVTAAGAINSTVTGIQTGSTTRIDTSGNLTNIGTASMSGNLTFNSAATIQTTKNQTLTIGGDSTGNIILKPNNVTLATFTPTDLDMNNLPILNIGNAGTDFGTNGGLTLANALTVTSGGIGVTTGGITITAGGLGVTAGNISLTGTQTISATGDLTVQSGASNNLILTGANFAVNSAGVTTLNSLAYTWPSSQVANGVLTTNGTGTLSWANPAGGTGVLGFWQRTSGSLAPTNITDSINLGSTATSSALVHLAGTAAENSWINTGNVGIGTTLPLAKLDVNGTASISGALSLYGTPTIAATSMKTLTLGDANTGDINFYSSSNKLTSAGNLTLAGTITSGLINGQTISSAANFTGTVTAAGAINSTVTGIQTGSVTRIDTSGNLTNIGTASMSGALTLHGTPTIQSTAMQTLTLGGDTTGKIVFAPSNTTLMTLSSANLDMSNLPILNIGNAGTDFGTNGGLTLAQALTVTTGGADVGGNVDVSGTLTSGTANAFTVDASGNVSGGTYNLQTISSAASFTGTLAAAGAINSTVTGLQTGSVTRIDTSGNLLNIVNLTTTGSASMAGALTLTTTPTIGTTSMQVLTLGGATTGSVQLSPKSTTGLFVDGSGNVGIGTTAPFSKLNVAVPTTGTISFADSSNTAGLVVAGTGDKVRLQMGVGTAAMNYASWIQSSYDNGGGVNGAEPLLLNPNGGNVGIGTTGPGVKLDINRATYTVPDTTTLINVGNSGADGVLGEVFRTGLSANGGTSNWRNSIYSSVSSTGGKGILKFSLADSQTTQQDIMTLLSSGSVGIGTVSPLGKVNVSFGNGTGATAPTTITTANNYLQLGNSEYGANSYRLIGFGYTTITNTYFPAYIGYQEATPVAGQTMGDLVFGTRSVTTDTQATERVRITNNGNVGIGTTGPTQKMHLASPTSSNVYTVYTNPIASVGFLSGIGDDGQTYLWNQDNTNLTLGTNATARVTILKTGNVGIGTTSPGYLLTVNSSTPGCNGCTLWTNYSDKRLKENINTLPDDILGKIMELNPISFNYNDLYYSTTGYTRPGGLTPSYAGFVAQQLQTVFPEMVNQGPSGYLDTNLSNLQIYLVKAIQEQQGQIDSIASASASLQNDVATISATLANLPEDISAKIALIPQIQDQIASLAAEMASVSGRLTKAESGITNQEASISAILSPDSLFMIHDSIDIATISASFANFSDSLKVIGTTQLAQTTIGGSLQVGFLHFDDLKAEISSLTGNVTINSNLNVIGDATVSGQLKVEKGIVLPDVVTGEDYCVTIKNGEIIKTKGVCQ